MSDNLSLKELVLDAISGMLGGEIAEGSDRAIASLMESLLNVWAGEPSHPVSLAIDALLTSLTDPNDARVRAMGLGDRMMVGNGIRMLKAARKATLP